MAAGLSYAGWWLSGVLIYFGERRNRFVRFHALQSIVYTGALTIVGVLAYVASSLLMDAALATHQRIFDVLAYGVVLVALVVLVGAWLTPLVAAWSGMVVRIPLIAPYAERYAEPVDPSPVDPGPVDSSPDAPDGL